MANRFKVKCNYGSHLPVLVKALSLSNGPVLEMGMGFFSTPVLHWLCFGAGRELWSYENDPFWTTAFRDFPTDKHHITLLPHVDARGMPDGYYDWDAADLDKQWGLVFIDHHPGQRRHIDARYVAPRTDLLLLHDCEGRLDSGFKYSEIYPLFKYRFYYNATRPHSMLLSNTIDLTHFTI